MANINKRSYLRGNCHLLSGFSYDKNLWLFFVFLNRTQNFELLLFFSFSIMEKMTIIQFHRAWKKHLSYNFCDKKFDKKTYYSFPQCAKIFILLFFYYFFGL